MIEFACQDSSVKLLDEYAKEDKHNILIYGGEGVGKTYLAKRYASKLNIYDIVYIYPKVNEIKDIFISLNSIDNKVVVIVENLDLGQLSCSYTILKYLEEPRSNVYIVLTCRNLENIPDTILSRSLTCSISSPRDDDINKYISFNYRDKTIPNELNTCIKSFSDVDELYKLSKDKIQYIIETGNISQLCNLSCKSISWRLSHFEDSSEIESDIMIRYIMRSNIDNYHIVKCCLNCINLLSRNIMPSYIILSKFAYDIKYCD